MSLVEKRGRSAELNLPAMALASWPTLSSSRMSLTVGKEGREVRDFCQCRTTASEVGNA